MSKLEKGDKELLTRVNEVLHYIWDPIGVSRAVNARDEYDSYALQIFSLLKRKSSSKEVANFLTKITVDSMGMNPSIKHDMDTAILLVDWMEFLKEKKFN